MRQRIFTEGGQEQLDLLIDTKCENYFPLTVSIRTSVPPYADTSCINVSISARFNIQEGNFGTPGGSWNDWRIYLYTFGTADDSWPVGYGSIQQAFEVQHNSTTTAHDFTYRLTVLQRKVRRAVSDERVGSPQIIMREDTPHSPSKISGTVASRDEIAKIALSACPCGLGFMIDTCASDQSRTCLPTGCLYA